MTLTQPPLLRLVLALLLGMAPPAFAESEHWDLIPFDWVDDFENGELNSWETYPFFQDMGFNPTIRTITEPAFDGSVSLTQNFIPTDTDFPIDRNLVGVIKRGRLLTSEDSRLSCAVFLNADRRPEKLEIALCAADGRMFVSSLEQPPANQWIEIDLVLANFSAGDQPLVPGIQIEAVRVLAQFGVVSPDRSYSLNLDSFHLNGERRNRFVATEPKSTWLEPFQKTILHRHYHTGEAISVRVKPIDSDPDDSLQLVTVTVLDGQGKLVAEGIPLSPSDGSGIEVWVNEQIYSLKPGDPPGRWRLRLSGKTSAGQGIENDLEFLVPVTPTIHSRPRLLFSKEDIGKRVLERSHPGLAKVYEEACATARSLIEGVTPGDHPEFDEVNSEYLGGGSFSPHWPQFYRWVKGMDALVPAKEGAFLYALADDDKAGDAAKSLLLHVCRFGDWNHPWMKDRGTHMYYPMGYSAYRAALAFDLLYPLLSEGERKEVFEGLFEKGIQPCYLGEVLENHIPSNISNHLGVSCTGGLLAAISLLGENPENPYMEPFLSGILAKLEAHIHAGYLSDKSYAESFSYYHMDSDMTVKAAAVLERNFGIDLTSTTHIKDAWYYPMYVSTPNGRDCLDMGDGYGHWAANGKKALLWNAYRMGDPLAWARYQWAAGLDIRNVFPTDFYDYLWFPTQLETRSVETLPTSRWFYEKGMAVFRSGWGAEDWLLLYKAGPHSNHHHLDQGNLLLRYGGETLLDEGGYADYYENKYYHSFYTHAVGHNTLLLGNYPESQDLADLRHDVKSLDGYPRIIQCTTGEIVDALESELSTVYKGRLSSFHRSIVFPKPDYLVLFDDIVGQASETYDWLFHARGKQSIRVESYGARILRPTAELRMEIISPRRLTSEIRHHPHGENSLITFSTSEKSRVARFLSILIPSKPDNREDRNQWKVEDISGEGWLGAKIHRREEIDTVLFRTANEGFKVFKDCSTDADRFLLTKGKQGEVVKLWLRNFTSFSSGGQGINLKIGSDQPTTLTVLRTEEGISLETDPEMGSKLFLTGVGEPSEVRLNGETIDFEYDSNRDEWVIQVSSHQTE